MSPDTTTNATEKRRLAGQRAAATRKRNAAKQQGKAVRGNVTRTANAARASSATLRGDAKRTLTETEKTARAASDAGAAEVKVRTTQVRQLAERSVDVPVGVSLLARDNLVSTVRGLASTLGDRSSIDRELGRYERRGASARNRFERQVRRTRTSFEREVRQRRARVGQLIGDAQERITSSL